MAVKLNLSIITVKLFKYTIRQDQSNPWVTSKNPAVRQAQCKWSKYIQSVTLIDTSRLSPHAVISSITAAVFA